MPDTASCGKTIMNPILSKFIPLCLGVIFATSASSAAAADPTLAERHVARGLPCTACHDADMKLKSNGDYGICASCHGDYDAMIKRTEGRYKNAKDPNPHEQHDGALPCTECHKGHAPGKNYCSECHSYTYKVP